MAKKNKKFGGELEAELMRASYGNDLPLVKELLAKGANPNLQSSKYSELALGVATSIDVCRTLLEAGADPNLLGRYGSSAYHSAISSDSLDRIRLFEHFGADINHADAHGWLPIHRAALSGSYFALERLLGKGVDPNHGGLSRNVNPLGLAVVCGPSFSGALECVKLLLAAGANPNQRESNGETPMHAAARRGWKYALELMIDAGGKLDEDPLVEGGLLHESCRADDASATMFLLGKYGLDVDVKIAGRTLLQMFSSKPQAKAQIREGLRQIAARQIQGDISALIDECLPGLRASSKPARPSQGASL